MKPKTTLPGAGVVGWSLNSWGIKFDNIAWVF
jgi:hypothetical protein